MSIVRTKESHNHPVNIKRMSRIGRFDPLARGPHETEEFDGTCEKAIVEYDDDENYEYMIEEDLNVMNWNELNPKPNQC